jgi:hypothetical protein
MVPGLQILPGSQTPATTFLTLLLPRRWRYAKTALLQATRLQSFVSFPKSAAERTMARTSPIGNMSSSGGGGLGVRSSLAVP